MTKEFFLSNVTIVNVANKDFAVNECVYYSFSKGFAFYVPGYGYAKFKKEKYPYVLGCKKYLKAILTTGGFTNMDDIAFVQER